MPKQSTVDFLDDEIGRLDAENKRLRTALSNLSNAAAIVFSKFEPKDGPGETAKALLKMELGLKD